MPFASQFNKFDPLSGDVPSHPFVQLPETAARARALLKNRTVEELEWAAMTVDWMIDDYFSSVKKHEEIERLEALAYQGYAIVEESEGDVSALGFASEEAMRFFEPEERGSLRFIPEMEQELLDILWMDSSLVGALKACIGWYDLEHDSEFPDGRDHEYFAVLSLWLVSDTLRALKWPRSREEYEAYLGEGIARIDLPDCSDHPAIQEIKGATNQMLEQFEQTIPNIAEEVEPVRKFVADEKLWLSSAANKAISAMEAVSLAEHLAAVRDAGDTAIVQEKKRKMDSLQIARHAMNRAAKERVQKDWAQNRPPFTSAEKAADYYVPWLTMQAYDETSNFPEYSRRTVAGWIRITAKTLGKRIR